MRDLKKGDKIHCKGMICEIDRIVCQEPWEWRNAYYIEFYDVNGRYHNWKQNVDGGYADLKGE